MGSVFVVVSTPILQLFLGIRKAHEPVRVQALRAELAVERVDEPVIGYPDLVRGLDVELPVESMIDHNRWLTAIAAEAAPVADLRLDPGKLRQSGDPVRTDAFALFNQIIMQLAIAVDLAALRPGLVQQLDLAPALLRPCAQRCLQSR